MGATVNVSKDVDVMSEVLNGAKVDLDKVTGLTLAKGMTYTISVPAGVLTDYAGNKVAATSKSFTTLAGTADTTAPSVVMTNPVKESSGINGRTTTMSLWFSEDITAATGSITVTKSPTTVSM